MVLILSLPLREDAKPLLEEAKVLDVQIRERATQVAEASNERNITLENKKQQELQWKEKQEDSNQLLKGIDALKKWKEENNARQPVAENQSLIVSKLDDAWKQLDTLLVLTNNITSTTNNVEKQKNEKEKLATVSITISLVLFSSFHFFNTSIFASN